MTRDSIGWWVGIVASVLVAVAASFHLFPWIPLPWQHGISLAAFVTGIISGKMASSPLKHSSEKHSIRRRDVRTRY